MTYLEFLFIFVICPATIIALLGSIRAHGSGLASRLQWHWMGTLILAFIAFVWTTPWDNYIVANGVWSYGEDRVIAVIGYVPIEEYFFFILMPVLNSAFYALFFIEATPPHSTCRVRQPRARISIAAGSTCLMALAGAFLRCEPFTYLGSTILWFLPALWIQWAFDPRYLMRRWGVIAATTLVPTLYLSVVDAWAISEGIWTIHEATRTGWDIASLPFEEAFFFFITSLLLSQGLTLWHSLKRP